MLKKETNVNSNPSEDWIEIVSTDVKENQLHITMTEPIQENLTQVRVGFCVSNNDMLWSRQLTKGERESGLIVLNLNDIDLSEDFKHNIRMLICLQVQQQDKNPEIIYLKNINFIKNNPIQKSDKYNKTAFYGEAILLDEEENSKVIMPYYDYPNGDLKLSIVDRMEAMREKLAARLKKLKIKGSHLTLEADLELCGFQIKDVYLRYRSKVEKQIESMDYTVNEQGEDKIKLSASIDLSQIKFVQLYWDAYILIEKDGVRHEIKIKHKEKKLRLKFFLFDTSYYTEDGHVVFPYFARDGGLVLHYREKSKYDGWNTRIKEGMVLFIYYLLKPYWKRRNIWLVFEKFSVMAQDNGYYFFQYCMEQLPEKEKKNIFYVIDKEAPDYENVKQYGKQVLPFMSFKHCLYYKAAKLFISSDTKNHGYAWRSKFSFLKSTVRNTKIAFLQHGVTAFKRVHPLFGKNGSSPMTYFIATSEYEKNIIHNNFDYDPENIPVTGFARWDVLENKANPNDKQILLMPTWRSWIEEVEDEVFVQSDYFKNYTDLLNNQKLMNSLKKNKIRLVFYIHPKFRDYMENFKVNNPNVTLIPFGQEPLNELMMKCSLLITDYSSVAWDVYYLEKPVVFYQFDYEKYEITHGSYMDMTKELFGERVTKADELIQVLNDYIENNFKEKDKYREMRDSFFAYRDNYNSKRIYEYLKRKVL
ncbi:CDP-glycerol glycerophosphotransferase family protein [Anaerosacchariphilus polymeriproducens]|uniref:Teichoic acid biosynthesis protein TagF n=1 Tax=Anaerosacchariphilus polymeriproducens TaxID=1812858 RepID=A0A371ARA2_9FIRM|nr:CDP-glycerol glycerophosphotransferase family protein [Anaerosacchariphilus polymeriproducens]RDU22099.1 teichoic acid biosynthesis protein TagF [Anaerosacchariphilus polymeriproducens]